MTGTAEFAGIVLQSLDATDPPTRLRKWLPTTLNFANVKPDSASTTEDLGLVWRI
jgi:hypothetical protein